MAVIDTKGGEAKYCNRALKILLYPVLFWRSWPLKMKLLKYQIFEIREVWDCVTVI